MKIRIINSKPRLGEGSISHLEGKEFEVKLIDAAGHYIGYGETGLYLVHEEEFEVVGEEKA